MTDVRRQGGGLGSEPGAGPVGEPAAEQAAEQAWDGAAEQASDLAAELTGMMAEDGAAARLAHSPDLAEQAAWRRLTARHGDRFAEIMTVHGWPTERTVGPEAARAAWLLAQHADRQLDVQRRAAALMGEAVDRGEASARDLAFLQDRLAVNEGREQRYGTQIGAVADGRPVPWPCEEPGRLDERRAEVGIEPFDEYTARFAPK